MVAMKGDKCVAIATDKRLGIQAQTISMDFQKVFEMGPHLYIGLPGLATDTQTVMEKLRYRCGNISFVSFLTTSCVTSFTEKTCTS